MVVIWEGKSLSVKRKKMILGKTTSEEEEDIKEGRIRGKQRRSWRKRRRKRERR